MEQNGPVVSCCVRAATLWKCTFPQPLQAVCVALRIEAKVLNSATRMCCKWSGSWSRKVFIAFLTSSTEPVPPGCSMLAVIFTLSHHVKLHCSYPKNTHNVLLSQSCHPLCHVLVPHWQSHRKKLLWHFCSHHKVNIDVGLYVSPKALLDLSCWLQVCVRVQERLSFYRHNNFTIVLLLNFPVPW